MKSISDTAVFPSHSDEMVNHQGPDPYRPALRDCALVADWRRFLFVHFTIPPEALAPHVPFELDLHEGRAFVSLVYFTLERMRPPFLGKLGETLLRPISAHPFLNLRTYVTHCGQDGICFLAEWIPNRLSLHLGPLTYGLPYHLGEFTHHATTDEGVSHPRVVDPQAHAKLELVFPSRAGGESPCVPDTTDAFLLERYCAYTFRGSTRRRFGVAHQPWRARGVDMIGFDTTLIEKKFPWFSAASFHSAHVSPGVSNVEMGFPHFVSRKPLEKSPRRVN